MRLHKNIKIFCYHPKNVKVTYFYENKMTHVSHWEHGSRTYKELLKLNKKTNKLIKQEATSVNQYIMKK